MDPSDVLDEFTIGSRSLTLLSRGRIERLMRHHGIRAIMARPRRMRTTDSRHDFPIAPNLLDRNFTATAPNRISSPQRDILPLQSTSPD